MTDNNETLHPGRILLAQAMEPLGISRNQLARDIDVPVGRISDITNGKRGVTADTALRLGRYFGTGPELWLRLQAEFDLYVARSTTWPAVESRVRIFTPDDAADAQLEVLPSAAPAPEAPAAAPAPEETPFETTPLSDESAYGSNDFAGLDQEPLADPYGGDDGSLQETDLEARPNSIENDSESDPVAYQEEDDLQDTAGDHDEPALEPELPPETPDHEDDRAETPRSLTIEQEARDADPGSRADPAFSNDPEEDLGIPPIPDSKLFVSG